MLDELERWLLQSKTAVVLVSGDPGIFSLAEHVVKRFGAARCQIVPAVSSVQVAFARLGLDWVDAKIVSAHGRDAGVAVAELSRHDRVAILAGTADGLDFCADAAEAARASHNAFLCENLTLPDERVRRLLPEEIRRSGSFIPEHRAAGAKGVGRMSFGMLYGIGVGPGDPEWITVKAARVLGVCRHVFTPKRATWPRAWRWKSPARTCERTRSCTRARSYDLRRGLLRQSPGRPPAKCWRCWKRARTAVF